MLYVVWVPVWKIHKQFTENPRYNRFPEAPNYMVTDRFFMFNIVICKSTHTMETMVGMSHILNQTHEAFFKTHRGRVELICVNYAIIGSDNGLSPVGAKPFLEPMLDYC